jgi:class 3 adenylate cyclase
MTPERQDAAVVWDADVDHLLRQVRRLDPNATQEAVRRFRDEIAAAAARVGEVGVDVSDPLPVAFSPAWPEEADR